MKILSYSSNPFERIIYSSNILDNFILEELYPPKYPIKHSKKILQVQFCLIYNSRSKRCATATGRHVRTRCIHIYIPSTNITLYFAGDPRLQLGRRWRHRPYSRSQHCISLLAPSAVGSHELYLYLRYTYVRFAPAPIHTIYTIFYIPMCIYCAPWLAQMCACVCAQVTRSLAPSRSGSSRSRFDRKNSPVC